MPVLVDYGDRFGLQLSESQSILSNTMHGSELLLRWSPLLSILRVEMGRPVRGLMHWSKHGGLD